MTRAEKDNYWMDLIQQCRVSGMSDYAWCNQNGISISSFYYNVRRLRTKACIPDSVAKVTEKQEVVPIHYNELQETKMDASPARSHPTFLGSKGSSACLISLELVNQSRNQRRSP